jgi:hypothetical protein
MYVQGLGFVVIGCFEDHDGFDGVMLGMHGADYHFEFTCCRRQPIAPTPTPEDLIVLYLPSLVDWQARCESLEGAGFREVRAHNPYWSVRGRSFEDADGYRVVVQNEDWVA